ncbi:MAG: ABC transporter permease [Planctomycetes bacterium]|nr:ABC transporter permease [Planctomycetota bacterium]
MDGQEPTPDITTTAAAQAGAAAAALDPGQDSWSVAWRQLRKNRMAMAGLVMIFAFFGVAAFAPLLATGRPLFLRAHVPNLYETDLAAFLDWDRRLREATLLLGADLTPDERARQAERRALYLEGLPEILARLEGTLDGRQRAAFAPLRDEYLAQLRRVAAHEAGAVDLDALAAAGAAVDEGFGALSLGAAYKRAAVPLLAADDWIEAVADARLADRPEEVARLAEQGRFAAEAVEDGVARVMAFLPPERRGALADAAARGLRPLRTAEDEGWRAAPAREAVDDLEAALDRAAATRVPAALQQLPQVTLWPAFRYLTAAEVAVITLYLACCAALVLRGPFLRLSGRGRAAAILAPAVAVGLLWGRVVPPGHPPADSLYKELALGLADDPDAGARVVFPPVPFGENENIYADRTTPPVLWELLSAEAGQGLARRLREPGEEPLTVEQARVRLDRLRTHWLGTDDNGRDILARLIIGSRVSLSVGFVAVSIYLAIGIVLGALAGYFKGWVDVAISRVNEVVTCFPAFFLIISVMSILDPSIWSVMIVIGLTRWTEVFRLVRAEFLRLTALDFVVAGQALGLSSARIVFRHVLPNALGPVFVAAAFGVAGAILIESALSFLGFGVPAPQASWGSVLHDARGHERLMWWVTIFPGLLIFLTVTAYNLVGEGLRDALDPRLRR